VLAVAADSALAFQPRSSLARYVRQAENPVRTRHRMPRMSALVKGGAHREHP